MEPMTGRDLDPLLPGSFRVIPAIDLLDGKAVRLWQGDYGKAEVVDADPMAVAERFAEAGATRIHLVDLSGARSGSPAHAELIGRIVARCSAAVQVGGGLRSEDAVARLLDLGVAQAIVGTVALEDPALLTRLAHRWPGRILVGLDARGAKVALRGWFAEAAESLTEAAARVAALPIAGIVYTDILRDGTGRGPNFERTWALARGVEGLVIASGGVASVAHLETLRGYRGDGLAGAIVGRAIYHGGVPLEAIAGLAAGPDTP